MTTAEFKPICQTCGSTTTGSASDVGCFHCLLQLGLSGASPTAGFDGWRSSASHGVNAVADQFVRQGVLPQFGDYQLESEIARGGMGVVYRARQKSLNRTVAIKMILAGQLATPESVERFRLEAEAAARLHHPGIVPIYEIGEYETQHFYSMELIEGVSLAECVDDFRLQNDAERADQREQQRCLAELMARVARALHFAHQRGVLHRDLKPSNILIDEQGEPHLIDFGLAKLTARETSGLTLSSTVLGTPGYLAPEQAAGAIEQVTTAADVYGLGATLYELLTGQPPFVGVTTLSTILMALEREPQSPRSLNPSVDRDLETIALRCLEKAPERRYATAAAVAEDLERYLRREPILARPVTLWEQVWKWRQRNPWLAGMAAMLTIAILLGSGTALWQWVRAERANVVLTENVAHLQWSAIDTMLLHGESSRALAKVASLLRDDPNDWKAAMFAMSVMEQRRFPVPAAPPIRHPGGEELAVARLSPDGRRIVTASYDDTARLWDASTSEPAAPPLEHLGPVNWAAFRPAGRVLATGSEDQTIRLWDVDSGRLIAESASAGGSVLEVQFSSDGRYLLARTAQAIAILDGSDARLVLSPLPHAGKLISAQFVADGTALNQVVGPLRELDLSNDLSRFVMVDGQGRGWVADFPAGQPRQPLLNADGPLDQVRFDTSGELVAAIGQNHWARVWNASTGLPVTPELSHFYLVEGLAFLPGDKRLLTWGSDALAQVWEISSGERHCEPMRHANRLLYAEAGTGIGQEEMFLTTLSHLKSRNRETKTGAAQLWRVVETGKLRSRYFGNDPGAHDGGRLSPNGRWFAVGRTSQEVWVYDVETAEVVAGPLRVSGSPWGLMFSPDGSRLITTTSRGQVATWSLPDGKLLREPVELGTTIQPTDISSDGKMFATGATDGIARIWDSQTGLPIHELRHGAELNSLDFSHDGRWLASAGEDRRTKIWDTATGQLATELMGHQNEVMTVRFSPDGQRLVTGSLDFTARVWDARTGRQIWTLPHQGEVLDACFSPDGRWVATGSRDRMAIIWDSRTGQPYSHSLLHEQGVRNVRFSPDGSQLMTLDFRGLRLWDVATSHPLTVHLRHAMRGGTGFQSDTGRPGFTPDGRGIGLAGDSEEARLWHISIPPPGAPAWFPELLEAVAGQRFLDGSDRAERVPPERFLELEQRVGGSTDTDFYTRWAAEWLGK